MNLYSYQQKCIEAILTSPCRRQLISMPTGTGKTITFLGATRELKKQTLILVHRQELTHKEQRLIVMGKKSLLGGGTLQKKNLQLLSKNQY